MIQEPPTPPPAPTPGTTQLDARDRAEIAQSVRDAQATAHDAQRVVAQAQREAAQAGKAGVVKEPNGTILVTGADGRTIQIPVGSNLDGDQIQQLVQNALQPVTLTRADDGPSHNAVQVVAIVFFSLLMAIWLITRAVRRRPLPAGAAPAVLPPETVARLARIEQAVEAVAIEVERISEAQRYSAQLLTERLAPPAPALGGRTAEAPVLGAQPARG